MNFLHCKKWSIHVILSSLLALVISQFVLYSQNTLLLNDQWIVEKRMMAMGLIGADEFLIERNSLAQNHLELTAHYGHHEVRLKRLIRPNEIKLKARIDPSSMLDIKLKSPIQTYLFRISRDFNYPSAVIQIDHNGRFHDQQIIEAQAISFKTWNSLHLKFSKQTIEFWFNEQKLISIKDELQPPIALSFKAELLRTFIDDLIITESDTVFTENFSNSNNALPLFAYTFTIILSLLLLGELILLVRKQKDETTLFAPSMALLTLIVLISSFYLYDFYYWSNISFGHQSKLLHGEKSAGLIEQADRLRFEALKSYYGWTGGKLPGHDEINSSYPTERIWEGPIFCRDSLPCSVSMPTASSDRTRKKILLVGTSQSIGAGAKELDQTFFVKTHQMIRNMHNNSLPLDSLNISVSGFRSPALLDLYQEKFSSFTPDVAIFNLSFNDQDGILFEEKLGTFISLFSSKKTKCVLIQEPTYYDSPHLERHKILEKLAAKHSCYLLKLHHYMQSKEVQNTGHLWWDFVHLSSTGQDIVAQWLAPQLDKRLYP